MSHDLIGFVLGALNADELQRIERELEGNVALQTRVREVREQLQFLEPGRQPIEPPVGLAERTCCVVFEQASRGSGPPGGSHRSTFADVAPQVASDGQLQTGARTWTMADFVVAAGVCVAAACLFFPALVNSRWHAQRLACEDNLRTLGQALNDYSQVTGGYFPGPTERGPLSVAGVYAVELMEKGLVPDTRRFHCPAKGETLVVQIPRLQDILSATPADLVTIRKRMGGDFAYTLGYVRKGRLFPVRNQGRSYYAVLSDVPLQPSAQVFIGSHGKGGNVLYEDGHVRFDVKRKIRAGTRQDDLFANDRGEMRAGLHPDDTVLAPSDVSPLPVSVPESFRAP